MALRSRVLAAVAAALPLVLTAGGGGTVLGEASTRSRPTGSPARAATTGSSRITRQFRPALLRARCAWGLSRRLAEYR